MHLFLFIYLFCVLFFYFIYFSIFLKHLFHSLNLNKCFKPEIFKSIFINLNLALVFCFTSCCYISALVLTCLRLMKGRATFFQSETIVASFRHFVVLLFTVFLNHSLKRQFLVLYCGMIWLHKKVQTFGIIWW